MTRQLSAAAVSLQLTQCVTTEDGQSSTYASLLSDEAAMLLLGAVGLAKETPVQAACANLSDACKAARAAHERDALERGGALSGR